MGCGSSIDEAAAAFVRTLTDGETAEWLAEEQAAADAALHLKLQQDAYSAANPRDSGRMGVSWRTAQGAPDGSVAGEGEYGDQLAPEYSGKITMDGDWFISNNLEYAWRVANDPLWAENGDGGPAWYTSISTQRRARLEEELKVQFRGK